MSDRALPLLGDLERARARALVVGLVGSGLTVLGLFTNAVAFFRSYLFAYLFWLSIAVGCLSLTMIHHLTGGRWGLIIRRILEAGIRTIPLWALLFVPIALGLGHLYPWARPALVAADPVLQHKARYLNVGFFIGRAAFYFAVWSAFAYFLSRWSRELDGGVNLSLSRRLRGLSGGGLVLMGLTITFSSVDWAMSLEPHWSSTIYGILFMVGQALSALSFVIVVIALVGRHEPFAEVLRKEIVHDLGKLLLAFVMLWAYVNLSQFLIVWSANLPEEIPWYIHRFRGGWQYVGLAVVTLHFFLPFLLLLSRDLKRNVRLLGWLAGVLMVLRVLDLYWLIAPSGDTARTLSVHWTDLTALAGLGGLWLAEFLRQLRGRPLLPLGEPEWRELTAQA